jgi:hypothetical protein
MKISENCPYWGYYANRPAAATKKDIEKNVARLNFFNRTLLYYYRVLIDKISFSQFYYGFLLQKIAAYEFQVSSKYS